MTSPPPPPPPCAGKRSVALRGSGSNQDGEGINHLFSQGGLPSTGGRRGFKGSGWHALHRTHANADQSLVRSAPLRPTPPPSEPLVHHIKSTLVSLSSPPLPGAGVRQIGAFTFSLCHRFVFFHSTPSVRLAAAETETHESETREEAFPRRGKKRPNSSTSRHAHHSFHGPAGQTVASS